MKKDLTRRIVWLALALCIIASMLVFACAEPEPEEPTTETPTTETPTTETPTTETPALTPQYGGDLILITGTGQTNIGYPAQPSPPFNPFQPTPAIENLLMTSDDGNPIPWLCTGWDLSMENLTLTLNLREGVKFHDGTDFNAEAAKWCMEALIESAQQELVNVASIDVIDDYTLRLNMSSWDGLMVNYFSLKAAQVYSPTAVETYGGEWAAVHPVGTGPFKFADYERDVFLKFERFDDYWQEGKPYLDSIEWMYVADPVTRTSSFLAGEGHLIAGLSAKDANDIAQTGGYEIRWRSPSTIFTLQTDSKNADSPYSNLKVRQAMSHAIDNEAICDAFGYGYYEPVNQVGFPGYTMYNPDIVGYPYDPDKAKALLTEAGYPNGFDTTIYYSTGNYDNIYLAVQEYLNAVGISAQVELVESGRAFEISTGGWQNGIQTTIPPYTAVGYPPAKMLTFYFAKNSVFSVSRMLPDEIEELTLKALAEPTAELRWKDTQEINKLIIDKYCLVHPMFVEPNICALVPELHDDRIFDPWKEVWWPADAWLEK